MTSQPEKNRLGILLNRVLDYTETVLGNPDFSALLFQSAELIRDDRILPMLELLDALCAQKADAASLIEVLVQTVRDYPIVESGENAPDEQEETT